MRHLDVGMTQFRALAEEICTLALSPGARPHHPRSDDRHGLGLWARGCRTSIAHPTFSPSPSQVGHPVRAVRRRPSESATRRGAPRQDPPALRQAPAPRAAAGRRASGTAAPRQARARPGSPPRGRRGDAGGIGGQGSTASSGLPAPSDGCDAPGRTGRHSPESGSPGPDAGTLAARRGIRPGPGPDLDHAAVFVMAHHHPAGVARQALGRFRRNARAVFEDRLARLLRVGQRVGVDMDHHLVAFARGAGIEFVMQRRLGEQGQGIGLPLGQARAFPRERFRAPHPRPARGPAGTGPPGRRPAPA